MTTRTEADPLRAVSPKDFVQARSALAAKLEKQGKVAEARQVRRLRRPSPVVWALNNVGNARGAVDELAEAVSQLRRAQLGQGDLQPAMQRYRAAIGPIVRGAAEKLRDAGVRMSPALERRLHDTLLAAAADRRLRADLMAGRLMEERAAAGFDVLTQGPMPAVSRRAPASKASGPAVREPSKAERRRRLQAERTALKTAQQAERRARREAKTLDATAKRKERAAEAAEAKVEAMRATLLEAERRAAGLRRAAAEARDAHRDALGRTRASGAGERAGA